MVVQGCLPPEEEVVEVSVQTAEEPEEKVEWNSLVPEEGDGDWAVAQFGGRGRRAGRMG